MFKFVKQLSKDTNLSAKYATPRPKIKQRWSSRMPGKDGSSEQAQNATAPGISTPAQAVDSLTAPVSRGEDQGTEEFATFEAPRIGRSDAPRAAGAAEAATTIDGEDSSKPAGGGLLGALSANYLFKDLATEVVYALIRSMQHVNYGSKRRVLMEGSMSDACYVLVKGSVDVLKHNKLVFTFANSGIVGELGLVSKCKCPCTIRTKTKCTFFKLKRAEYQRILCDVSPWRLPSTAPSSKPLRRELQSVDLAARVLQRWARVRLSLKEERAYVGVWIARDRFYAPKNVDGGFQEGYVFFPAHPVAHLNAEAAQANKKAPATSDEAQQKILGVGPRSSPVQVLGKQTTKVRPQTARSSSPRHQEATGGVSQQSKGKGGDKKKPADRKRPLSAAAHFYRDQATRRLSDTSWTVERTLSETDAVAELAELRRIPPKRFDLFGYDVNRPARLNWLARRETKAGESIQVTHAHRINRADEFLRSEQRTRRLQEFAKKGSVKRAREVAADASLAQEIAAAKSVARRHAESAAAAAEARRIEDLTTFRQREVASKQFVKAAMAIEKCAAKEISRAKEVVAAVKKATVKGAPCASVNTADGNRRRATSPLVRMAEDSNKDGINLRKRPSTECKNCRPHRDEADNNEAENDVHAISASDDYQTLEETACAKEVTGHIAKDPPQPLAATVARRALEVAAATELACRAEKGVAKAARIAAAKESIGRRIVEAAAESSSARASKEAIERHAVVEAIRDARQGRVQRPAKSANVNTPSNKKPLHTSAMPILDPTLRLDTPQRRPKVTKSKLNRSDRGTMETRARSSVRDAGNVSAPVLKQGANKARVGSSVWGASKGSAALSRSKCAAKVARKRPQQLQRSKQPASKRDSAKMRAAKDSTNLRASYGASTKGLEPKLPLIFDPLPVAASVLELPIDPLKSKYHPLRREQDNTSRIGASIIRIQRTIRRSLSSKKLRSAQLASTAKVLSSQRAIPVVIHPVDERNCAELLETIVRNIQCMVRQRASRNRVAKRLRELRIEGLTEEMITPSVAPSAAAPNFPLSSPGQTVMQNVGSRRSPTDAKAGRNSRARSSLRGKRRHAAAGILQRNGRMYIAKKRHKKLVAICQGRHELESFVLAIQCMVRQRLARNRVRAADRRRLLLAARGAAEHYRKSQLRPEGLSALNARIKDTLLDSFKSEGALSPLRHEQSAQSKIGGRRRAAATIVQQMFRRWSAVRCADGIRVSRRKEARRLKQYGPSARAVQRSWRQCEARRRVNLRRDAWTVCTPIIAKIIWSDVFVELEKRAVEYSMMYSRAVLVVQRQGRIAIARNRIQKHQRNHAYNLQKRSKERRLRAEAREQQKRDDAKALEDEMRTFSEARKREQAEQRRTLARQEKLHNLKVRMFDRDRQSALATLQRKWREKKRGKDIEAELAAFLAQQLVSMPARAAMALQEAWRRRLKIRRGLELFISLAQYEKTMELAASMASNNPHTHREEAFSNLPPDTQKRYTVVVQAWRLQKSVRDSTAGDRLVLLRQQPVMEQEYYRVVMLRNEERRVKKLKMTHAAIQIQAIARRWRTYSHFFTYPKRLSSSRPGNESAVAAIAQAQATPKSAPRGAQAADRSTSRSTESDSDIHAQLSTLRAQHSQLMETMHTLLNSQQAPASWNNGENQHPLHSRDHPTQRQSSPLRSIAEQAAPYERNGRIMHAPGYRNSSERQTSPSSNETSPSPNAGHPYQDIYPPRYGRAQTPTLFQRLEEARTRAATERSDGKKSDDEGKRGGVTSGSDGDDWVRNFDPGTNHYYYSSEKLGKSTWTPKKVKVKVTDHGPPHHHYQPQQQQQWQRRRRQQEQRQEQYHHIHNNHQPHHQLHHGVVTGASSGNLNQSNTDASDWNAGVDPESGGTCYYSERKRRSTWTAPEKDGTSEGRTQHHTIVPEKHKGATPVDSSSYSSRSFRSRSTTQSRGSRAHNDESRERGSREVRHQSSKSSPASTGSEFSGDISDYSHSPHLSDFSRHSEVSHSSAISSDRGPRGDESSACQHDDSDSCSGRSDDMSRSMRRTGAHRSHSSRSHNETSSSCSRKPSRNASPTPSQFRDSGGGLNDWS